MVRVYAYGSNLCIERLRARTPSASVVATGTVAGHALRWHKRCPDGSGKCDAFFTGDDSDHVWGAVYELSPGDKVVLDRFEGLGHDYFEKLVAVRTAEGRELEAIAYVANPALYDHSARPFRWYKAYVTTGARQHGFPEEYLALLEAIEERDDADAERHARESETLEAALRQIQTAETSRTISSKDAMRGSDGPTRSTRRDRT
jgi:gamma-glutamylcyclotransferase